ncbi:hypothetical protein Efla_002256 [Eimeria flavescens]
MASSILEVLRSAHEEVEKLEDVAAQLLLQQQEIEGDQQQQQQQQQLAPLSFKPKRLSERKRRESLRLQSAVADCLLRMQERASSILSVYADADGMKREETLYLGGQRQLRRAAASGSSTDVWVNFYDRIKEIRQTHKKRQIEAPEDAQLPVHFKGVDELLQEFMETPYLEAIFLDSEAGGRRVDLSDSYRLFSDLKRIQQHLQKEAKEKELSRLRKKGASAEALAAKAAALDEELGVVSLDYLSFLRSLGDFSKIPRHLKYKQPDYLHFLTETDGYLEYFFQRRYPLTNFEQVLSAISADFKRQYEANQLSGWEENTHRNPLYCRVTDRLFASPGTLASHQQGAKYKKKLVHFSSLSAEALADATRQSEETDENLAFLEYKIKALAEMLHEAINHTIAYHQKQQSTNPDEAEEPDNDDSSNGQDEAAAAEEEESEAEEEGPVYNPLNLPLGFDGRPIPYWLYKLHGLGQEFKCEICGNFSYWGRRAFERHFSEWRHSFGMRCLKIPNTTHFKVSLNLTCINTCTYACTQEITKIEDAILLYEKLKKQAEGHSFKQDQELECEDAEGNVMNLRAFEDLRRQGLI